MKTIEQYNETKKRVYTQYGVILEESASKLTQGPGGTCHEGFGRYYYF